MKRTSLRWPLILIIVLSAAVMALVGRARLNIDTDITRSLPAGDPVIADSRYVMMHHPVKDRIVIDLSRDRHDPVTLVDAAVSLEERLAASGLFKVVGMEEYQALFPALISHVLSDMPVLFREGELEEKIRPLLEPGSIRKTLAEYYRQLLDLEGIGRANMMALDPLRLRNIVLARMAHLAPSKDVQIFRGHLLSSDSRHLLVVAEPRGSATDSAVARRIASLLEDCESGLGEELGARGMGLELTPVGAYRAALDNEETAKRDTRMAVIFATVGIAILLLLGFPRPLIGILALSPAILGTITAGLVYSLFTDSISILAMGFGVTIISFTVDYGIAYLLFLDRPYETRGSEASKEIWSVSLLAMMTTAISFSFLFVSGFPALAQIGFFTALGVMFTYVFVHTLFPLVFSRMPPAGRKGLVPLQGFVDGIMRPRGSYGVWGALAFWAVMLVFARPDFRVDLASLNTVSRETLAAERLVTGVWGDVLNRVYLMTEARSLEGLQQKGDRLLEVLEGERAAGRLSASFVPSMVFPGKEGRERNLSAWRSFWTPERVSVLRERILEASRETGFAPDAFEPFFRTLSGPAPPYSGIPGQFHNLLGIHRMEGDGSWAQFSVLTPGPKYDAEGFSSGISSSGLAKLFDPGLFAGRLGSMILKGFMVMAFIVGGVTVLVTFFYLLDIRLALISMAPTLFSLVCTLGTLKLLGHQAGIPTIIVTVIVIGMGTDYALYLVRASQRYMDETHPSVGLIRLTIFLSAASTTIGFGVLSLADHALLRSAGLTLLLGIGYSFGGTVLIVPPLIGRVLASHRVRDTGPAAGDQTSRVERRYRFMEPYPRMFSRFKMRLDPMFSELPELLKPVQGVRTVIDIGCGYGVPACWFLEWFPESKIYGIDPDPNRVRVAAAATGGRGVIRRGGAPDIPSPPEEADMAVMLDSSHYLGDEEFRLTLERLYKGLRPGGTLMIRAVIPPAGPLPWVWWMENLKDRAAGVRCHYRSIDEIRGMILEAGFRIGHSSPSGSRGDLFWFVGEAGS